MVEAHRQAERREAGAANAARAARRAAPPPPARPRRAARSARARAPRPTARRRRRRQSRSRSRRPSARPGVRHAVGAGPAVEQRQDGRRRGSRAALAPVLPREEAVPAAQAGAGARQRRVAFRARGSAPDSRPRRRAGRRRPAGRGGRGRRRCRAARHSRGRSAGLRRDPGAQADLEGAVAERVERAEGQAGAARRPRRLPTTRIRGSPSSTATIAAVRPISIGVRTASAIAATRRCEAERRALEGGDAAADRARRRRPCGRRAPSMSSASATMRVRHRGRRGARAARARSSPRRDRAAARRRDEGGRGRAADAGPAMHHERRGAVPGADEVEQRRHAPRPGATCPRAARRCR